MSATLQSGPTTPDTALATRWGGATRAVLPGGRLHLQHGPIDLVLGAHGDPDAVAAAHRQAWNRFSAVLEELVSELSLLRRPVSGECPLRGRVAVRMWHACRPFTSRFITPMAAVAGAVADEIASCYRQAGVRRAWVNNGGDIALHLVPGENLRVGLFADLGRLVAADAKQALDGSFVVDAQSPVRGVATSGWRGRSFSLGIADSVTVLAASASQADAAATMIANAVDTDDPSIVRRPAAELREDSDLGRLPVVVDVPRLSPATIRAAIEAGMDRARELASAGLIDAVAIVCQGQVSTLGLAGVAPALHNGTQAIHETA
jgi:uncharacterized protein